MTEEERFAAILTLAVDAAERLGLQVDIGKLMRAFRRGAFDEFSIRVV